MTDTQTCHVVVIGFEAQLEAPEVRLQRVFGLDAATCASLLESLPATVQRSVTRVRAEYFRRALLSIGAQVEVRSPDGEVLPPEITGEPFAAVPKVPSVAPPPRSAPPPPRSAEPTVFGTSAMGAEPSARSSVDPTSQTLASPAQLAGLVPSLDSLLAVGGGAAPDPAAAVPRPAAPTAFSVPAPGGAPAPAQAPAWSASSSMDGWPAAPSAPEPPLVMGSANPTLREAVPAPQIGKLPGLAGGPSARPAPSPGPPRPPGPRAPADPTLLPGTGAAGGRAAIPAAGAPSPFGASQGGAGAPRPFDLPAGSAPLASLSPAPAPAAKPAWPGAGGAWDGAGISVGIGAIAHPSGIFDPPPGVPPAPPPIGAPSASSAFSPLASENPAPASALPVGDFHVTHGWHAQREEVEQATSTRPSKGPPARRIQPGEVHSARAPAAQTARIAGGPAAVAPGGKPESASARTQAAADQRTFWESVGNALSLPFSGSGALWLATIAGTGAVTAGIGMAASVSAWLTLVVLSIGSTALLALCCDYSRACFWTVAASEPAVGRVPELAPRRIADLYLRQGLHLLAFGCIAHVPVIAWSTLSMLDGVAFLDLMLDPVTFVLIFLSHLVWPAAVGMAAFRNDFRAIWRVMSGARVIFGAPLPYFVIVVIGFVAFASSALALSAVGVLTGLKGVMASAVLGLPLALSHGIEGSLMGHLARTRKELFE